MIYINKFALARNKKNKRIKKRSNSMKLFFIAIIELDSLVIS